MDEWYVLFDVVFKIAVFCFVHRYGSQLWLLNLIIQNYSCECGLVTGSSLFYLFCVWSWDFDR